MEPIQHVVHVLPELISKDILISLELDNLLQIFPE